MILNILLAVVTLIGTVAYMAAPDPMWWAGVGLVSLSWLVYLLLFIPRKKAPQTRGWWALGAIFFISAALAGAGLLLYWQATDMTVVIGNEPLTSDSWGGRVLLVMLGGIVSFILTLLFFAAVGYFSVIYILDLPHEEGLKFWTAFRSYVALVLNMQYFWLEVTEGKVIEIRQKGFLKTWFSMGKIIVRPGNAVVLQKGGKITRICGAGVVPTTRNEFIRGNPIDLGPQFYVEQLKNVITADQVPLEIEVGISYKIKPALNPDDPRVIKEATYGVYPVEEKTLLDAAFKVKDWHILAQGAVKNNLRDQIMTYKVDDLFQMLPKGDTLRANNRQIREIEETAQNAVNGFATNMGIEITGVDIRQITLSGELQEAVKMRINAQAEAEAIHRIEQSRNNARGELIASLLSNISNHTNKEIGDLELQLAAVFAQLTRRGVIDDVLGHEYIEVLKTLAAGKGTNIFSALPGTPTIEAESLLPELMRSDH
jgi:regulator of protease activity HflC (stomatin/prohibitin superfamily)